ncbi:hypothetical protein TNCV_634121 [Trichonephila clavipes]|nr:hypothetical protein TNCV_634121 [Trichonephila clavipes]
MAIGNGPRNLEPQSRVEDSWHITLLITTPHQREDLDSRHIQRASAPLHDESSVTPELEFMWRTAHEFVDMTTGLPRSPCNFETG